MRATQRLLLSQQSSCREAPYLRVTNRADALNPASEQQQANARASRTRRFAVCIPKALNAQLAGTASDDGIAWFSVGVDKL